MNESGHALLASDMTVLAWRIRESQGRAFKGRTLDGGGGDGKH